MKIPGSLTNPTNFQLSAWLTWGGINNVIVQLLLDFPNAINRFHFAGGRRTLFFHNGSIVCNCFRCICDVKRDSSDVQRDTSDKNQTSCLACRKWEWGQKAFFREKTFFYIIRWTDPLMTQTDDWAAVVSLICPCLQQQRATCLLALHPQNQHSAQLNKYTYTRW